MGKTTRGKSVFIEESVADCKESLFQYHCNRRAKMLKKKR